MPQNNPDTIIVLSLYSCVKLKLIMAHNIDSNIKKLWEMHTEAQEQILRSHAVPISILPESAKVTSNGKVVVTADEINKVDILLEEMAEKGFQGIFLSRCKIGIIILDLLEISHIGEKLVRICKIFIDVIEIGKNHVTPENELVKRLSPGVQSRIAVIQFKQQAYPVS